MRFERAAIDQPRYLGLTLKRMKNIRAGIPCARCKAQQARSLVGDLAVCETCCDSLKADRMVTRQKETAAQMRPRR